MAPAYNLEEVRRGRGRGWGPVFTTALVVGLSGALSPGPLTVATIHEAALSGWSAGPLAVLTHGLLELAMIAALGLGLSRVLRRGQVAGTIALAGGAMLIWMGWTMMAGAAGASLPSATSEVAGAGGAALALGVPGLARPMLAGIFATLGNPYWFLWWGTVGASQLAWSRERTRSGPVVFWAGHVTADLLWLTMLAGAVASGRQLFTDHIYQGLLYVLGATMALLGAYFAASARRLYGGSRAAAPPERHPKPG